MICTQCRGDRFRQAPSSEAYVVECVNCKARFVNPPNLNAEQVEKVIPPCKHVFEKGDPIPSDHVTGWFNGTCRKCGLKAAFKPERTEAPSTELPAYVPTPKKPEIEDFNDLKDLFLALRTREEDIEADTNKWCGLWGVTPDKLLERFWKSTDAEREMFGLTPTRGPKKAEVKVEKKEEVIAPTIPPTEVKLDASTSQTNN